METQPYTYFPGGPVVENPPASAGNMGLIPGLGRCRLPWSNQAHTPEGCAPQQEKQPLLTATRESPCTAMEAQHSEKKCILKILGNIYWENIKKLGKLDSYI